MVPKDQPGRRVQPRDEHAGKHGEGVMIASLRPLDEFSLVHDDPSMRRGVGVALGVYVAVDRGKVPESPRRARSEPGFLPFALQVGGSGARPIDGPRYGISMHVAGGLARVYAGSLHRYARSIARD